MVYAKRLVQVKRVVIDGYAIVTNLVGVDEGVVHRVAKVQNLIKAEDAHLPLASCYAGSGNIGHWYVFDVGQIIVKSLHITALAGARQ